MVIVEDAFYAPAKLMRCFELQSGNVMQRLVEGAASWEVEGANPLNGGGYLLLSQREFASVTHRVYGIIEDFSPVAFSDKPEVVSYTFLLLNNYVAHLRLLWESENPYEIILQKTSAELWENLRFEYPQTYRFTFAQMGGRKAETAKGTALTFFNDNLLDYKKKILMVKSWKRDDMNIYSHQVIRSKDSFVPDYGDFMSLQL